jgi:hypothetical protein
MTKLEDHPRAARWLRQFDDQDAPLARMVLRSLKLVSYDEFQSAIRDLLMSLHNKDKRRTALFPLRKPQSRSIEKKEKRFHYTSAEGIGYFLSSLERAYPKEFIVSPTISSMRAEKTNLIVFVDDIIGSGRRLLDYWRKSMNPSLKSWLSYKKCRLFVATYAAHPSGLLRIEQNIKYFHENKSLSFCLKLPKRPLAWDDDVEELCAWYSKRTKKSGIPLGFGAAMTPIVFQHGCPNTAPVILWASGDNWEGLFPNRAVLPELYECFAEHQGTDSAEVLWSSGQYRLGLKILEAMETMSLNSLQLEMLTVLGLLLRGLKREKISDWALLAKSRIETIFKICRKAGLIDTADRVTSFGRDIVERFRRVRSSNEKTIPSNEAAQTSFFPVQYRGVQRKSSVESA